MFFFFFLHSSSFGTSWRWSSSLQRVGQSEQELTFVDFSSFCRDWMRPLSPAQASFSDDDRARSRLPRFPKCHWKCHGCVAMPAGECECACECVWLGSSHFYSLGLLLLLCCQSRWWLLRSVIISACGIWHLSTRPGFCVCFAHKRPSGLKKKKREAPARCGVGGCRQCVPWNLMH